MDATPSASLGQTKSAPVKHRCRKCKLFRHSYATLHVDASILAPSPHSAQASVLPALLERQRLPENDGHIIREVFGSSFRSLKGSVAVKISSSSHQDIQTCFDYVSSLTSHSLSEGPVLPDSSKAEPLETTSNGFMELCTPENAIPAVETWTQAANS